MPDQWDDAVSQGFTSAIPGLSQYLTGPVNPGPGVGATIKTRLQDPQTYLVERFLGYPWKLAKGLAKAGLEAGKDVAPMLLPGGLGMMLPGAGDRASDLANVATGGIPDQLKGKFAQDVRWDTHPQTAGRTVMNALAATAEVAKENFTPLGEMKDLIRGDKVRGIDPKTGEEIRTPMNAEELADTEDSAILKALPFAGLAGKVLGLGRTLKPLPLSKTTSIGEMAEASGFDDVGAYQAKLLENKGIPPRAKAGFGEGALQDQAGHTVPDGTLPISGPMDLSPEIAQHFQVSAMLNHPDIKPYALEAFRTETFNRLLDQSPKGTRITDLVADAIDQGALSPETIDTLATKFNLDPATAASDYAKALRSTLSKSGKTMNTMSDISDQALAEAQFAANALKTKEAVNRLRQLAKTIDGSENATLWDKAVSLFRKKDLPGLQGVEAIKLVNDIGILVEQQRRAMMVTGWSTATRNMIQQGANAYAVDTMENALVHTFQKLKSLSGVPNPASGSFFEDTFQNFSSSWAMLQPEERAVMKQILDRQPLLQSALLGHSQWETGNRIAGNLKLQATTAQGLGDYTQLITDALNLPNHMQEMFFRRLLYRGRLEKNLRDLGWKDQGPLAVDGMEGPTRGPSVLEQFNQELLKPEMSDNAKQASAEALVHALKQTYAQTPGTGLPAKALLDFYQATAPISTIIAPTYPRFLVNKFVWLTDHSPHHWFKMFSPEFRDALFSTVEEGGLNSRRAMDTLAQATTGAMLLTGAYLLDGEIGGPKYYQTYAGTGVDENGNKVIKYRDNRNNDPYVTYSLLARIIRNQVEGRPNNLTGDEWVDAAGLARRTQDVLLFSGMEKLRAAIKNDEGVSAGLAEEAWSQTGKYLAAWFTPMKTLRELQAASGIGGLGVSSGRAAGVVRDTSEDPLGAPIGTILTPEKYTPRVNFFTGHPMESQDPGKHLMIGSVVRPMTPLEEQIQEIPGININALAGSHKSAEVQGLVNKYIGQSLTTKIPGTSTSYGDILAETLKRIADPTIKAALVQKVFGELRNGPPGNSEEGAVAKAFKEASSADPQHAAKIFLPDVLEGTDPLTREILKKQLKEKDIKYPH